MGDDHGHAHGHRRDSKKGVGVSGISRFVTRHSRRIEVGTVETDAVPRRRRTDRHIGCPLDWLKRVIPIVQSKEQLAVALWLHRRRAVCKNNLFTVPNDALRAELGLSRDIKYKTLRHLEKAGVIAVEHDNKCSLQVRMLW